MNNSLTIKLITNATTNCSNYSALYTKMTVSTAAVSTGSMLKTILKELNSKLYFGDFFKFYSSYFTLKQKKNVTVMCTLELEITLHTTCMS